MTLFLGACWGEDQSLKKLEAKKSRDTVPSAKRESNGDRTYNICAFFFRECLVPVHHHGLIRAKCHLKN
jgi:hypothetical protein